MAKRVRDADLESRTARSKLKPRGKPYYRSIGAALHIGYRKGAREGKWVVRRYVGDQAYVVETIGTADDADDANGDTILNFWQAQERAHSGPYRVRDAIAAYRHYLGERGDSYGTGIRCERHILPDLGDDLVDQLTAERIRIWHRNLSRSLPMIPKKRNGVLTRAIDFRDAEAVRRRKVSANRVLTILKAALNMAFREGKVASDAQWRRVKPFSNVDTARIAYLTLQDCARLLNVCTPDFRVLVRAALETGARYGELTRLRCGDFNPDAGTVHIRQAKSGHGRHVVLTEDGQEFFRQLCAGRSAGAPILGREWAASHQVRRMGAACKRAGIEPAVGFHQLRHTWASHSVMAGMPLAVVATNLGHTDTRMVEKHYGHLAPSYVADAVRKHAPRFGKVSSNVRVL
ncbi:MAG TPA: site-specific integrase [Methyloceanibacter sp.]|nr:site-specific integrase [Methyloceanibacter sp.]